jgi:hypothetical protein
MMSSLVVRRSLGFTYLHIYEIMSPDSPSEANPGPIPSRSETYNPLFLHHDIMAVQSKEALSPWGSALAGALGAVFANTCVYPLDM